MSEKLRTTSPHPLQEGAIIRIYKPKGWTSFDAVNKVKWFIKNTLKLKNIKIGHAGTLDPLAEGLLIVCTGKKTKEIEQIQNLPKEYIATIGLGKTTPSYDLETEFNASFPIEHINQEDVQKVLTTFHGKISQTPPLFSAKKIGGKRAYVLARSGKSRTLEPVTITIYEIELMDFKPSEIKIRILCSKGTYIRSLAHDLGQALNSGGYLKELVRTRIGGYTIETASTPEETCSRLLQDYRNL
ncbi:MAG TPA: tRNA pseudouridine(55) synthase TruB [Salinivirgaceae bacterium]|nr:tRNA pseudouridine(55) synthase TruB [Salinivirgaceae bacterium]